MTNKLVFANNAQSTLAGSISNTATVLNLQAGGGALFPTVTAGSEYFVITITDAATGLLNEIINVPYRSGDTLGSVSYPLERGQEGTTALNWSANDVVAELWTAGQCETMVQAVEAQAQSYNYALDTGSANAYVCALTPTLSAPVAGMPIRVKIANSNTNASTLNPGPGAAPIIDQNGAALTGGELVAGSIQTFMWNAAGSYQWTGALYSDRPGVVSDFVGSTAPAGALLCYGQAVSRSTYSALNAIMAADSYPYGNGNGTTTFNLPDLRGRVVAGKDNMGGSAASRLTSATMTPDGNTLGATGGDEEGSFAYSGTTSANNASQSMTSGGSSVAQDPHGHTYSGSTTAASIIQPTVIMNKIIWY